MVIRSSFKQFFITDRAMGTRGSTECCHCGEDGHGAATAARGHVRRGGGCGGAPDPKGSNTRLHVNVSVCDDYVRTNNAVESFHSSLVSLMGR